MTALDFKGNYSARKMMISDYAKGEIAKWMLFRGHSFLKSAILLKQSGGSKDVELYNICQGLEVVLKSFLLFIDYDKYKPLLPKQKVFGHNLISLTNEVITVYNVKPLTPGELEELETLNKYYINHYLRYAGVHDIFFPSTNIEYGFVCMRILAAIKLAEKKLSVIQI